MSPRTYFRGSLLLPLLLPFLALPFIEISGAVAVLWLSLGFGGGAYLFFGAILFWLLGKVQTSKGMRKVTYWAPIAFIPVQSTFWIVSFYIDKLSNPNLVSGWDGILVFSFYILLLGYIYVGIVNAGYYILEFAGGVHE